MKNTKSNWAVFDLKTGFRLTEFTTRTSAILQMQYILRDEPDKKIAIKQKCKNQPI